MKGFEGVWIPAEVWHSNELTFREKTVVGFLVMASNEDGIVPMTNAKIAEVNGMSRPTASKVLRNIAKAGFLVHREETDVASILQEKNFSGMGVGSMKCEWCEVNTTVLHAHHYPIPKSEGGTETVDICPNCHSEFHNFYTKKLILTEESWNDIRERVWEHE